MPMKINEPWHIVEDETGKRQFPGAQIAADNGCTYNMDADRAKRLVLLWNAFLGVSNRDIVKTGKLLRNK